LLWRGIDSTGSEFAPGVDPCEYDNEPSGFIKYREFQATRQL